MGTMNLLAVTAPQIALIVVAVLAALAALIGFVRRFSRGSWLGMQICVLFAATFLLGKIPAFENDYVSFGVTAGAFLLAAVVVFALGGLLRAFFDRRRARRRKSNWFLLLIDSLCGAVNGVINLAVFAAVIGGLVCSVVWHCTSVRDGVFGTIFAYELGGVVLWDKVMPYVLDAVLVSLLAIAVNGGYRLGLLRSLWTVVMVLLGTAAFAFSVYAVLNIGPFSGLAVRLGELFLETGMGDGLALGLGMLAVGGGTFLLCLIVLALLNLLVGFGVRAVDRSSVLRVLDGTIIAVLLYAVVLAVILLLQYAVAAAAGGSFGEQIAEYARNFRLEELFTSSPLCKFFYDCNPVRLLLAKG